MSIHFPTQEVGFYVPNGSTLPALTNAERQRLWRKRQLKKNPDTFRQKEADRKALARPEIPVTDSPSKPIEAPSAEYVAAFESVWPRFVKYARAKLYSRVAKQDAEDLASEVRVRFFTHGGGIRDVKNVRAWMYRALKNLLADRGDEGKKQYRLIGELQHAERTRTGTPKVRAHD